MFKTLKWSAWHLQLRWSLSFWGRCIIIYDSLWFPLLFLNILYLDYIYIFILTQLSHFLLLSESTLFLAASVLGLLLLGGGVGVGGGTIRWFKIMSWVASVRGNKGECTSTVYIYICHTTVFWTFAPPSLLVLTSIYSLKPEMNFECALPLAWERWVLNVHCHWHGRDEFWMCIAIGLGEMSSECALPLAWERWVLNVHGHWLGRDEFWTCIAIAFGEMSFECALLLAWERWVLNVHCHWLGRGEFWMCMAIGLGEMSFECALPLAWDIVCSSWANPVPLTGH